MKYLLLFNKVFSADLGLEGLHRLVEVYGACLFVASFVVAHHHLQNQCTLQFHHHQLHMELLNRISSYLYIGCCRIVNVSRAFIPVLFM